MKLSAERYYEWMLAIEKMNHQRTRLEAKGQMYQLLAKEIEISQLKLHIFKDKIKHQDLLVTDSKREYDEVKSKIEAELGFSLNGCSVTENFEILKLDSEET
jgi:hypothetical protein